MRVVGTRQIPPESDNNADGASGFAGLSDDEIDHWIATGEHPGGSGDAEEQRFADPVPLTPPPPPAGIDALYGVTSREKSTRRENFGKSLGIASPALRQTRSPKT